MSKMITFKGKLGVGLQDRLHLSTNDGLTGYRIKQFQIIGATPGVAASEYVGKIYLTDQTGSITSDVDLSQSDLIAVNYTQETTSSSGGINQIIIFDNEIINQDIFVNITDASGATVPCNYYIELEQIKLDLNTSTYITVKNIRSRTQS
jgi:hypothetical protein